MAPRVTRMRIDRWAAAKNPGATSKRSHQLSLDRLIERGQQIDRKTLQHQIVAGSGRVAAPPDCYHGHAICGRRQAPKHPGHRLTIGHGHVDQCQIVIGRCVGGRKDETVGVVSRKPEDDLDNTLEGQTKPERRNAKRWPGIGVEGDVQSD